MRAPKRVLLVIADYKDWRQEFFDNYFSPLNKKFADIHGYEYIISKGEKPFRDNPTWWKFTIVRDMIETGFLQDGDRLLHLDADMKIEKFEVDYPCDKSFSYAIDNGNTHCMGNYALNINPWSRGLIDLILSDERFEKLNDKMSVHEHFGYVNSFWHEFREQASWYSLAGIKRHSSIPFFNIMNFGWHSQKDEDTIYSLSELYENVQVLRPEWNTTILAEENDSVFNINKTKKEDTKIRHYAGGQIWKR